MPANLLFEHSIDRRPDRLLRQSAEALDRVDHAQVEVLSQSRVDHGDRPLHEGAIDRLVASAEERGHFFERALRRGQTDSHLQLHAVRRGVERYRDAGATNPILTAVWGTDFERTLRAAAPVAVLS